MIGTGGVVYALTGEHKAFWYLVMSIYWVKSEGSSQGCVDKGL